MNIQLRCLLAVTVAALATVTAIVPAAAGPSVTSRTRLAGTDRYATAVAISEAMYPAPGPATVVVATGENYPDALAAGVIAGNPTSPAPVLLVRRDQIPAVTEDELRRLAPDNIVVLGGTDAISEQVVTDLRDITPVISRIAGRDRYETAAEIAYSAVEPGGFEAYLASGEYFQDALLASSVAGRFRGPVLLTSSAGVPSYTRAVLDYYRPNTLWVVGPVTEIPDSQLEELRGYVERVVRIDPGSTLIEAAINVSQNFYTGSAPTVFLATHEQYPDALAAGALASVDGGPLLFSSRDCIPPEVEAEINRLDAAEVVVVGGTAALSEAVEAGVVCS